MSAEYADHVLGLDVGGTSTRALAVDLAGRRHGVGAAGGGNPVSVGHGPARTHIADAVAQALHDLDPNRVGAVVMGIAGLLTLHPTDKEAVFDPVWRKAGLRCPVHLVPDAVVAFTAATPLPAGTVLIAGTGAVACGIEDRQLSGRRADGYGWLLGDLGSGTWLGKRAAYAALQAAAGIEPAGRLATSVQRQLLGDTAATINRLVAAVMATEPVHLSRLAPLVSQAVAHGDPVAETIVDEAVGHLLDSVAAIHDPAGSAPIALAGSLATKDTPVSQRLRASLAAKYPRAILCLATDGAAGAAWLAARELITDTAPLDRLHHRLTR